MKTTTWGEKLETTMSDIFDIMAHEPIKIEIAGELNAVDGTLYVQDPAYTTVRQWILLAEASDCETFDKCLAELVAQYQQAQRDAIHQRLLAEEAH